MPKIKCKYCPNEWDNINEYMRAGKCDNPQCAIKRKVEPNKPTVLENRGEVQSTYDKTKDSYYIDVPKVLAIHIFPSKK